MSRRRRTTSLTRTTVTRIRKRAVNPHSVLAAAFLVLLSLCDNAPFEVEPADATGNDWLLAMRDRSFIFNVYMDVGGEPDYLNGLLVPGLEVTFGSGPEDSVPVGLDDAWSAIFTNLIRMGKIAERVTAACRVHPSWPYA